MKKPCNYKTPRGVWLSLEEYDIPWWWTDYFEDEYLLVTNEHESAGFHKVPTPFKPGKDQVWTYFDDDWDETYEPTHYMLIPVTPY